MTMPARERLRELVTDFYHGLITEESYHEQRATLLDDIEGFNASADETAKAQPQAPAPPPRPEPEPDVADEPVEKYTSAGPSPVVWVGVAVVVVVLAGAAFFFLGTSDAPETPREAATEEVTESVPTLARGETILEQFLEQNIWSRDSLANLSIAWSALDDEQRDVASQTRTYRRMTSRLHQRIREELALDTTGSPRLSAMTDLAATLGAPYTDALGRTVTPVQPAPDPLFDPSEVETASETPATPEAKPLVQEDVDVDAPAPMTPSDTAVEEPADAAAASVAAVEPAPEPEPAAAPPVATDVDDSCPPSLAGTRRPFCRDTLASGGEGPALVVLKTGSFEMGSDRRSEEQPVHSVDLTQPIAVSMFEVSVGEFQQYCEASGAACPESPWTDADAPVVMVSWDDASAYAEWLSQETGFTYRLPTEAEWEYAARAGTDTPYSFGDEITPSSAHSSANGPVDQPLPKSVRTVNPNDFKIFHMSGNVREWVADGWRDNYAVPATMEGSQRAVRGGSFSDRDIDLRSAARKPMARDHKDAETGFRVIREVSLPYE